MNNSTPRGEKTQTFKISFFQNKRDTVPQVVERSWDELVGEFEQPYIRADKDGELFAAAVFEPAKRLLSNVKEISILSLDIDHDAPDLPTLKAQLDALDVGYFIYSTHSHLRKTDKNPNAERRYRVAIPLACPIPSKNFPALWQHVKEKTGLPLDESAKDASRMFYTPVIAAHDAPFVFDEKQGEFLNWENLPLDLRTTNGNGDAGADETQPPSTPVFEFHTDRHAELCRLVEKQARATGRGTFEMKCPAHSGKGNSSLFFDPATGVIACIKKPRPCTYFDVLSAFGLSRGYLPKRERLNSLNSLNSQAGENEKRIEVPVLSDVALHGLAGDIVSKIEPHTESDNSALLVQLLSAFGVVINKGAYFRAEADHHYTKINAVMVGMSSKGRKGSSWGQILRLITRADESFLHCVQDGLSSGEGLIYHVRDPQEKETPIKEKGRIIGYQPEVIDSGAKEKRVLVLEPEFARVLRAMQREGNTLSSVIRQAWDSDRLRVMTKNPITASEAHIAIIGHITKEELRRNLDETETANGFANRFVWVFTRRSKFLPEGGSLEDSDLNGGVSRLRKAIDFSKNVGELKRDEEARKLWISQYEKLSTGAGGLLGSVTSRAEAQVMRLACIYALLDCSLNIKKAHLEAALALWQYCEDSARYIFGGATGDKVADDIITALEGAGGEGMDRTQISNLFQRHKSSGQINTALKSLLESGRITRLEEKTPGRTREIFKLLHREISEISEISSTFDANPAEEAPENAETSAAPSAEKNFKSEKKEPTLHPPNASETVTEEIYACAHCGADIPIADETCPKCEKSQLPTF
jgi:rubrerythrin